MTYSFNQYQDDAIKTLSHEFHLSIGSPMQDALHGAIGLVTEAAEMIEAVTAASSFDTIDKVNFMEEIGDYMWYLAIISDSVPSISQKEFDDTVQSIEECGDIDHSDFTRIVMKLTMYSGQLLDMYKKGLFYNKALNIQEHQCIFSSCVTILIILTNIIGGDIYEIMQTNINKLKTRFPDKFTCDAANHRDLERERAVLEEG